MSHTVTYVDVLLPLALPQDYTYAVPVDLVEFCKVGQRVIVQFGKNKYYTAIIKKIHHTKPAVEPKLLESLADEDAIVTETQLKFWKWIAGYYLCTEGEVMNAALPTGLKLSSETKIIFNESYEGDYEKLTNEEFLIVQALRAQKEISIPQVQEILQRRNIYNSLKNLFNLGIAITSEEIVEKYKARTETFVHLHEKYHAENELEQLFIELSRAPKQVELLLAFSQLEKKTRFIKKSELIELSKSDASVLKRLCDKNIFQEFKVEVSRLGNFQTDAVETPDLSDDQKTALAEIDDLFIGNEKQAALNVVLLHGVTSSGKTQVYIEKIKEAIAAGEQVLYMLPEIALTAQIINRLRKFFGNSIGIYHSKFNQSERVEIWNKVLHGDYKLVIAARSGVFLPYKNLGLVIVDEEHDSSFKQYDPDPRYQARDAAIVLANYFGAKVLLGSATPSVESYYNAERGKYGLVKMDKRFGDVSMPEIIVEDVKRERKKKTMHGSFSETLTGAINEALHHKEQAILFLNRRGFSQYQTCRTCGYVYKCRQCDVSLTFHKFKNKLVCHYCGYTESLVNACKSCGALDLDIVGSGTEKIEDEISNLIPEAKVGRLDLDTTRGKHGHSNVIASFENKEIDILVGTQMVTKGLDFDSVSLVGIMNADQLLFFPGYKSYEKAFQLLTQVSGRAGRRSKQGKVVIQTSSPDHPIIKLVTAHNFQGMYEYEMHTRRQFNYPPFARMVQINLKCKDQLLADKAALFLSNEIRKANIAQVLGPTIPFISKIRNYYLRDVLVKTNAATIDLHLFKQSIRDAIIKLKTTKDLKSVIVNVDVDP